MGYESLSTVEELALEIILIAFLLPKRTVKGMKRVIEHREDRFSPSLHLVDADSGTRFSDETAAKAKGAIMQSNETHEGKLTDEGLRMSVPFVVPRSAEGGLLLSRCW